MKLLSRITSKYQITIPKEVRETLKLNMSDTIEWTVDQNGIHIQAADKPFLRHRGILDTGSGDIRRDIRNAWTLRARRYSQ